MLLRALRDRLLSLLVRRARSASDAWGLRGEDAAARLLKSRGYRVLGRSLRLHAGEIDILAEDPDGKTIVVVEVKTRVRRAGQPERSARTPPEASITAHKRRKLVTLARSLARSNGWQSRPLRIDVVAVEWDEGAPEPVVRHSVGAVRV